MAANEQELTRAMGEFFDFGSSSMPESAILQAPLAQNNLQMRISDQDLMPDFPDVDVSTYCPDHVGENCECERLITDFGLNQPDTTVLQVDNYANFAAWIPRYNKPGRGCEYCRSKQLECWFTYEGQHTCSPCNALFRSCSFSNQGSRPDVVMDTLHVVQEDQSQELGGLTGIKAMKSYDRSAFDDEDHSSRKTGARFPRAAVRVLKAWMDEHADNPYPTEQEKEDLQNFTGLNPIQITNWMANTRRRRKTRTRGTSPSIRSPTWPVGTPAIDIPFDKKGIRHNGKSWDIMNPLERWQHSPPENEPAAITDIAQAISTTRPESNQSSLSSSASARPGFISNASSSSFGQHRPRSVTSCETTGFSESLLSSGLLSSGSLGSSMSRESRNSHGSFGSRGKDRRRRRRTAANPSKATKVTELRPFQCTFCTDKFKTKYDWSRHEKSLHLSLEKWICAPLGPVITVSSTGQRQCVYCGENNPNEDHVETHNHRSCEEKGIESRTFYRKDHLRQHLRLVHGCKMIESTETWKAEATYIKSRCGFCKQDFTKWQDRLDHLSKHYRAGAQMKDWKGCRGLDPAVAAQVTNAMPPYLIGNESLSPYPFSASNEATWGQLRCTVGPGNDREYTLAQSPGWVDLIGLGGVNAANLVAQRNNTNAAMDVNLNMNIMASRNAAMTATTEMLGYDSMDLMKDTGFDPMTAFPDISVLPGMCGDLLSFTKKSGSRSPEAITCWEILTVRLGIFVQGQVAVGIIPTDAEIQREARHILYEDDDSWNQTAADNREWLELFKKAHGLPSTAEDTRIDFDEDLGARIAELDFDKEYPDISNEMWSGSADMLMAMDGMGQVPTTLNDFMNIPDTF